MMNQLMLEALPNLPYAVEEALNRLRVNVGFCGKKYKKIMVTSSMPNEGKSFINLQMWRMFAESGMNSILVDADMRQSVIKEKYGVRMEASSGQDNMKGLSDYLATDLSIEDVLCETNITNGYMIPNITNVINPSILLENGKLENLLDEMAEKSDYVFVDSPPLNLVSDGEKIGTMCDGVILVVRASDTPKDLVHNSVRQLERAGCPLLGVVLNRVEAQGSGYYSKKYYGKYYYGRYYGKYYGKKGEAYYYGGKS